MQRILVSVLVFIATCQWQIETVRAHIDGRTLPQPARVPGVDPHSMFAEHAAVASDNRKCSEIGADMLRRNGHAVDGAIATALCLGA